MQSAVILSTLLFFVSQEGTPEELTITLCLNGKGPLSCEKHKISSLNLDINTNIPNKSYEIAGIKVNTSGYTVYGPTLIDNGYALFYVSDQEPCNIVISPNQYGLVYVGNPGNSADITGFGAVDDPFWIGEYPVSIANYTVFLNAVAKSDPYSLYDLRMATDLNSAGILRTGTEGNYSYSVMNNGGIGANRPITYVSWFSSARFANWMSNGSPVGEENSLTTEDGAYTLLGAVSGLSVPCNSVNPNTGLPPTYYLPTEDQWYKAAYYDPTLNSAAGGYKLYGTGSNEDPNNQDPSALNVANYFGPGVFYVTDSSDYLTTQNYLSDIGVFIRSGSYYGVFDASGNVWEWNDLDETTLSYRGIRGGSWFDEKDFIQSYTYATLGLSNGSSGVGFRLASPGN
jgi:formylglycine-generating enzyme required for sulfatase activity